MVAWFLFQMPIESFFTRLRSSITLNEEASSEPLQRLYSPLVCYDVVDVGTVQSYT